MSAVGFQLIDDEKIDDTILRRDFIKYTINPELMLITKFQILNSNSLEILILFNLVRGI